MLGELDSDEVCADYAPIVMSKASKGVRLFWNTETTWLRKERIARRRRMGPSAASRYRILCKVPMRNTTGSKGSYTYLPTSRPAMTNPNENITSRQIGTRVMASCVCESPKQRRPRTGERQISAIC